MMKIKKEIPTFLVDRTCVIITTSEKNQKEIIDKLISLGGKCSNYPYEKEHHCFETGHKIIYIYGDAYVKNNKFESNGFYFCKTMQVARNEVPCGELSQKDIEKYFKTKNKKRNNQFLSRENADIYAPIYNSKFNRY